MKTVDFIKKTAIVTVALVVVIAMFPLASYMGQILTIKILITLGLL